MKRIFYFILLILLISCSVEDTTTTKTKKEEVKIPKYKILYEDKMLRGGKFASVLMQSLSIKTPVEKRKEIAKKFAEEKGYIWVTIYSTEEAMKANENANYSVKHPGVLEKGFIVDYNKGKFVIGRVISE